MVPLIFPIVFKMFRKHDNLGCIFGVGFLKFNCCGFDRFHVVLCYRYVNSANHFAPESLFHIRKDWFLYSSNLQVSNRRLLRTFPSAMRGGATFKSHDTCGHILGSFFLGSCFGARVVLKNLNRIDIRIHHICLLQIQCSKSTNYQCWQLRSFNLLFQFSEWKVCRFFCRKAPGRIPRKLFWQSKRCRCARALTSHEGR